MAFKDTVFSRTTEGETRARQPRSIASLELRATLLLVDGKLSVRELKQRFGASLEIEANINELHRQGLISSLRQKPEHDTDIGGAHQKEPRSRAREADVPVPVAAKTSDRPVAAAAEPAIVRPFDESEIEALEHAAAASAARKSESEDMRDDSALPCGTEARREPSFEASEPEPDMIGTCEPEINEDALMRADTPREAPAEDPERGPNLADRTRGGVIATRYYIGRAVRGLVPVLGIGVLAALVVAAFLLPERYRETIEAQAAMQIGHPIQFGALRVSARRGGSLQLSDVRAPGMGELSAANVYIAPDYSASFRALAWRVNVTIDTLRGRPSALSALLSAPWPTRRISAVSLTDATVLVGDERWSGFDGEVALHDGPRVARVHSAERRVVVEVKPADKRLALDVLAVNQPLRVFPGIALDTYQLNGTLGDMNFEASALGAGVFGGKLTASGQLSWNQGAVLAAKLTLGRIETARLFKAVGAGVRVDGAINGEFDVTARAAHPAEIRTVDALSGEFVVENGTLYGMDFGAALRERGMGSIQGGETHFDALSGRLEVGDRLTRVTIRKLDAGALDGRGEITIGALEALSGRLSTAVGSNARRVRMPVIIAGSLAAPVLEVPAPPAPRPPSAVEPGAPAPDEASDVGGLELPLEVPVAPGSLR